MLHWTEAEAHRGANDIATCVVKFLEEVDQKGEYESVILYSDTCGGQNRNRILITAIPSFLAQSTNIRRVEQKFLESGHSQMECDSMHSAIERCFERREIYLPSDYIQCMKLARKANPYKVTEICHGDISDFGALNTAVMSQNAFNGIIKYHHIVYEKSDGDPTVSMAEEIGGERRQISYRKRGGRTSLTNRRMCYNAAPGIDSDKKKDLLSLVELMTNKSMARLYYNSLSAQAD